MTLDMLVSSDRPRQMLFPFMLEMSLKDYVVNEIPYITENYNQFKLATSSLISLDEYMAEHYCNPDSKWYAAEKYAQILMPKNYE